MPNLEHGDDPLKSMSMSLSEIVSFAFNSISKSYPSRVRAWLYSPLGRSLIAALVARRELSMM